MYLLTSLAERVVQEASEVIDEEIIVINEKAEILAATNRSRVGSYHEIAAEVLKHGSKILVTPEKAKHYTNVRAGITLPIKFRGKIIGVVGITGREEKIGGYAALIQRMTELILDQVYVTEITSAKWRSLEGMFHELIRTSEVTKTLRNRASILGLRIDEIYTCVLMEYNKNSDRDPPYPFFLTSSLLSKWGDNQLILLIPSEDRFQIQQIVDQILSYLNFHSIPVTKIGVSSPKKILKNIYKEAETAILYSTQDIIFYEDLFLELILRDLSKNTEQKIINDTKELKQNQLIETLYTLFNENLSLKKTSEVLHIHVNTLHYRLKKVTELTGLDWKKFPDVFILYIATLLLYDDTI